MGVIENRIDITELERSGGGGGGGTAASVSYDNTTSGLTATTVQGAIDEVASGLSGANTNITGLGNALTATQGNLAPVENGETSAHAYAVGDYLMHLNSLMRVTAPIAIGDTFAAGTNISAAEPITDNLAQVAYTDADTSDVDTAAITISTAKYMVKNGICFVILRFSTLEMATVSTLKHLGKFPAPANFSFVYVTCLTSNDTVSPGYAFIEDHGNASVDLKNLPTGNYRAFVSYPVQ